MKVSITNTPGILHLVQNAQGRNRSVYENKFIKEVDPNGKHMMAISFLHNSTEIRTKWLCKMLDSSDPIEIWLDVDAAVLKECVTIIEMPD